MIYEKILFINFFITKLKEKKSRNGEFHTSDLFDSNEKSGILSLQSIMIVFILHIVVRF